MGSVAAGSNGEISRPFTTVMNWHTWTISKQPSRAVSTQTGPLDLGAGHAPDPHTSGAPSRAPHLYLQVLVAIALGVLLGLFRPDYAVAMKPLGDGFIKLIKMLIAPIVFTTIVTGIAQTGAMKHVGRIGLRALLYFEVVSTVALIIGLIVVRTLQPGVGASLAPTA